VVGGFATTRANRWSVLSCSPLRDDGLLHHVGFTLRLKREDKPALTTRLEKLSPHRASPQCAGRPSRCRQSDRANGSRAAKARGRICYDPLHRRPLFDTARRCCGASRKSPQQCTVDQVKQKTANLMKLLTEKPRPFCAAARRDHAARAVERENFAGEIERAGDQDARRRRKVEPANRRKAV